MTVPVRLRPEAERDLREATTWYDGQREGLGRRFLGAASATLSIIAENPAMYPLVYRQIRRALIRRFPFGIFYECEERQVVVLAIMHARRDPGRWMRRG